VHIWLHHFKNQAENSFFKPDTKIIKLTLFISFKGEYLSFATNALNFGIEFEQIIIGLLPSGYDEEIILQIVNHRFSHFMLCSCQRTIL
jgi:hypothetical protein